MGNNRATPRRAKRTSRRKEPQRADKSIFLAMGLFLFVVIVVFAVIAFLSF